jgi:CRP/FNR family transcriptional regulator
LVFDATAKVAHMLSNNLEIFNKQKRSDISFMLHIQPETLSRVLKRMVRNELIIVDKGKVEVINIDALNAVFIGTK